MRRRDLIILLGGAAVAWPLAASAQQVDGTRRICVLMGAAPADLGETYLATFLRRLRELGWTEGSNAHTEVRWWTGGPEQMRTVVTELVAFSPDVIMVFSNLALAVLKPMAGKVPLLGSFERAGWGLMPKSIRRGEAHGTPCRIPITSSDGAAWPSTRRPQNRPCLH
jgi:hypothetical protein